MKYTLEASAKVQHRAKQALMIQDASNIRGLSRAFAYAMTELHAVSPRDLPLQRHPITMLWIDKFCSLARMEQGSYVTAYLAVDSLAAGKDVEYEVAD